MRNTLEQCDQEKAINELVRGQRSAKRLKTRLQGWASSASTTIPLPPLLETEDDLAMEVLTCLENTLSIVKNSNSSGGHDDERRRSKCEEYLGRSTTSTGLTKDRRGCYKRFRETGDSWIQDNPMPVEDGYRWRKYGQKTIHNTKYLRDYFRCTHKDDQGCKAKKHVQRIGENHPLYRTTYFEHHTCNDLLSASQFLLEDLTGPFSLINFGTRPNNSSNKNSSGNTSSSSSRSNDDNNNNTWSFFTSSQSSIEQEYNSMNSDRDLPSDHLISTYNKSPSLSHHLVSIYDQMDVLSTTSTTPILENIGFDDDDSLLFYFSSS